MTEQSETRTDRMENRAKERIYESIDDLEERDEIHPEDAMEMRRCVRDGNSKKLQAMLDLHMQLSMAEFQQSVHEPKQEQRSPSRDALLFLFGVAISALILGVSAGVF